MAKMYIDVFNGDADGIFSLIQLRKVNPVAVEQQRLVTGVKRDIKLMRNISNADANQAHMTVLDVSFDKNEHEVARLLAQANSVFYCDHHQANKLFAHECLTTVIDTNPAVCTALLINDYLQNAQPLWAVTAAYGDGLDASANQLADQLELTDQQKAALKELGVLINYNAYGHTVEDLYFAPDDLYTRLMAYDSPFAVIADAASPYARLKSGYEADLTQAQETPIQSDIACLLLVELPNAAWSNRISGTYGNILAAENRDKAIVIVSNNHDQSFTISLRAPKNNPYGAADICNQFATGGGREGAAGINALPATELNRLVTLVSHTYANERYHGKT
ncbi:MAG: acetyltransferase [Methylophilaceae bacterium]|nr:MAG: acetyltransferase [Methylophilaceae bacterium]